MMVSPGGDMFEIVWDAKRKELKGLNASGRSPQAASIDELKRRGVEGMPQSGIHTVTVPGAVDGWAKILERYGTMKLAQVLQPAIEYAERGFPVTDVIAADWRSEEHTSELQSLRHLVCRLLLEKKKRNHKHQQHT